MTTVAPAAESSQPTAAPGSSMRLNRYLARSGVASRRRCDALIADGQVRVNGLAVTEPGSSVVPGLDRVECAGRSVFLPAACEYVMLHKPPDCLVTRRDGRGRQTVYEYCTGMRLGTVAVGRLDRDTTGLLMLTDDGELAFRLMHPRYGVDKVYEAEVLGAPAAAVLEQLEQGVELEDGPTAPARAELLETWLEAGWPRSRVRLTIHEGRKHQVRRMLRVVGHPVRRLHRCTFGGLALDVPEPGQWRHLRAEEVASLAAQVGLERHPEAW